MIARGVCNDARVRWDDLEVVLAVARGGSLVRASEVLGVAHTTVGRRIRALEDDLGVRLFDRVPEGLAPTPAGEDVLEVARQVEDAVLAVEGRVQGRDEALRGPLRISTPDTLFWSFPEVFGEFQARYPEVRTIVAHSERPVSLDRREADVVLRLSSAPPEALVGRRITAVQFAIYASRTLAERTTGDLVARGPWIDWASGPNLEWFRAWHAERAPNATFGLALEDRGVLLAGAVRAGLGVQILPCFLADADPQLVRIAPLDPMFRLDLWVLSHADLRRNSRVRAFTRHVAEAFAGHRERFEGAGSPA